MPHITSDLSDTANYGLVNSQFHRFSRLSSFEHNVVPPMISLLNHILSKRFSERCVISTGRDVFSLKLVQFWNPCLLGVSNNHQGFEGFLGGQLVKSFLEKRRVVFLNLLHFWLLVFLLLFCFISPGFDVSKLRTQYTCYATICSSLPVTSRDVAENQDKDPLSRTEEVIGDLVECRFFHEDGF
jgi:hypothetical protein